MAIHIEHLNKYIGKQHVLKDICLAINDGEVVVFNVLVELWKSVHAQSLHDS